MKDKGLISLIGLIRSYRSYRSYKYYVPYSSHKLSTLPSLGEGVGSFTENGLPLTVEKEPVIGLVCMLKGFI